jgi:hypothetical protein
MNILGRRKKNREPLSPNDNSSKAADVLFALNPETSKWAKAGFSPNDPWRTWDLLGYTPEEADPHHVPIIKNKTLIQIVTTRNSDKTGLGDLDVHRVTDMTGLFRFSAWFDEALPNWDISKVSSMEGMFFKSGISPENLSITLVGWAKTAKTKKVKRKVHLSRLPHHIHDLSDEAQLAVQFLRDHYKWEIESRHRWQQRCPDDHKYCTGYPAI